ncbi:MAG TPA: hypothetical protein DEA96_17025 [Leptospiraceae bacterium]|nr:hypothetical protein [Spirochaetaceae bacterium]HBS06674.1 hypothetical protein [Leptospiraceae bacterium]
MLLIMGAFPPETELLEDLNGAGVAVQSAGIGPVEALLGLEAMTTEFAPDEVLFLGSCGQYQGSDPVSYISGGFYTFLEPASLLGRSRMVPGMRKYSAPSPGEFGRLCMEQEDFVPAIINTTMSLSLESHALSLSLLEQAIEGLEAGTSAAAHLTQWKRWQASENRPVMENLEVFGMARFCEIHKIGFTSLMAVTNLVGPEGSASWAENFRPMGRALQEKVRPLLEKWKG